MSVREFDVFNTCTAHTRMAGTVYLVRHCQSVANTLRRYNSTISEDEGLSRLGKLQAAALADFFSGISPKVYSSPFPRARETAQAIAGNSKPVIVDGFRELGCGQWDGRTEAEIRTGYPQAWEGWRKDPQGNPIPGGETLRDVQARASPEFERIVKEGGTAAIVTHYCVFNVLLCSLISSMADFRCFDTQNGTVAEIAMENVPRLRKFVCPVPQRL
jgi:broad specificity phosphatase PhoE